MKESEDEEKIREEDEVVLGGFEVHVKFTRYQGDPGILLDFAPPAGTSGDPQGIEDINAGWPGTAGKL
jgi:predicted component of type VI protein secretion system